MRIELVQGDITDQPADAVVNAANSSLLGGGGVDGAIHRRGGPDILAECRALRAGHYGKGLPDGRAVATTAGRLPARWVIHTVGPVHSSVEDRAPTLASCHTESLRVAGEIGAETVAFPAISTGIFRWPVEDAARIALLAVAGSDTAGSSVRLVRFVLFGRATYDAFAKAREHVGPTNDQIASDLAAQPTDRWRALFDATDRLRPSDTEPTLGGGERLDGSLTMPYPVYSPTVDAILDALRQLGAVPAFDWPTWVRIDPDAAEEREIADRPVATAVRATTWLVRQERFAEGTLAHALADGTFRAILARLRHWYDNERPSQP